jgi:hypothetical protein
VVGNRADLSYAGLCGTGLREADLTGSLGWLSGMERLEVIAKQKMGVIPRPGDQNPSQADPAFLRLEPPTRLSATGSDQ